MTRSNHYILCPPFIITDKQNLSLAIPLNSLLHTITWGGRLGEGLKCYKQVENLGTTHGRSIGAGVRLCSWFLFCSRDDAVSFHLWCFKEGFRRSEKIFSNLNWRGIVRNFSPSLYFPMLAWVDRYAVTVTVVGFLHSGLGPYAHLQIYCTSGVTSDS